MNILVINVGSSSIKFSLFNDMTLLTHGLIESNDEAAFKSMYQSIADLHVNIDAVGHRVVHGGEHFSKPTRLTPKTVQIIEDLSHLAPLHNLLNLLGIRSAIKRYPHAQHIAVFDTAFHHSMPEYAYRYALPYELYETYHIRKYGFHGSSHHYLALAYAKQTQRDLSQLNLITLHLGNGCSMCAIKEGKSVDTTMGFTPLDGLIMGTRSGSIDATIPLYLLQHTTMNAKEINTLLNKKSGLQALCGASDMRTILQQCDDDDTKAELAVEMFVYSIKKSIGAYIAILGRVDALIFSGGIGEHSSTIREKICENLEHLGISLKAQSPVETVVIPTNEELYIATEVQKKLKVSI
jgi:acetate kinase